MAGPRILVIDEDPAVRTYIRRGLAAEGYRVEACAPSGAALEGLSEHPADLLILGIDLPQLGGADVIRRVREMSPVPIVALSEHSDEASMDCAFEYGADDFIVKPFRMREVLARTRNALRHTFRQSGVTPIFASGGLKIDLVHRRVWSEGKEVHLPAKPYEVLRLLVQGAGKVLTHKDIISSVWGAERADRVQYLRLAIRGLRHKLEPDPAHPVHILTETRVGYRLRVPSAAVRGKLGHQRSSRKRQG